MDDHGDDFGRWGVDGNTDAVQRTEEDWARIAGYVRHAAAQAPAPR